MVADLCHLAGAGRGERKGHMSNRLAARAGRLDLRLGNEC